jgi:leucyl-tRNA synthetase
MMECLNAIRAGGRRAARAEIEPLIVMIAPFAPHVAEELWERAGHDESIFDGANWPKHDPAKTVEDTLAVAVQVNGKVRGQIAVPAGAAEAEVVAAARAEENVAKHLTGASERRVVYVKGRLVNFVVIAET